MSSQQRFGYEWDRYSWVSENYQGQFRNWTAPLAESFWKDKRVLDVGCGMGRNSYWPMRWGARSVTAFDYDERSVARAKETLKEFPSATVLYKSVSFARATDRSS
jgi:predicted RNA methylase